MSALIIQELRGARRSITLRGRALPERGPEFGLRTRAKQTWYAGTGIATLQVLGAEVLDTEFVGVWSDRHLAEQVSVEGFAEVATAAQLVRAFESICAEGQRLRVSWGPFVRSGVLAEFVPKPDREVDIGWQATFRWDSREDQDVPVATFDAPPETSELRASVNAADDEQAMMPGAAQRDYAGQVRGRADEVRRQIGRVFDRIRTARRSGPMPLSSVLGIAADVELVRSATSEFLGDLVEVPVFDTTDGDDLASRLRLEAWRRTQGRRVSDVRASTQRSGRELRKYGRPGGVRIVEVQEGETLRSIARREYGSADDWQRLADANGLVDSIVPAGLVLVVPAAGPTPALGA